MEKRQQELAQLRVYTENVEKEVTLLLQNLEWGQEAEKQAMVTCKHDSNHRVPLDSRERHEAQCYLYKLGYVKDDILLPEPADQNENTLVTFTKPDIFEIINKAATMDRMFRRGVGCRGPEPQSLERLQQVYSADERRAIYDAVVCSAPSCHDLTELDLLSSNGDAKGSSKKSRLQILAELRDMKRRRAKYRVPPATRNYSDVLRDVIKTQMDSYGEATSTIIKTEYGPNKYVSLRVDNSNSATVPSLDVKCVVKRELESSEVRAYNRNEAESYREPNRARSKERRYKDDRRGNYKDRLSSKDSISHQRKRSSDRLRNRYTSTEKDRQIKYDDDENRYGDKYKNHDDRHQREYSRDGSDRSREKSKRYKEHYSSRERSKRYDEYSSRITQPGHDTVIKQERVTDDYDRDDSRDRPRDRDKPCSKDNNNKYKTPRTEEERYSPEDAGRRKRRSSPADSYKNAKPSKRYKEISENYYYLRDNKRRYEEDKHSSRHDTQYDSTEKGREFSGVAVKQERESSCSS